MKTYQNKTLSFELPSNWPRWTPQDGPVPGVFINKPLGARCVWTARWMSSNGELTPDKLLPVYGGTNLPAITHKQARYELLDLLEHPLESIAEAAPYLKMLDASRVSTPPQVAQFLASVRQRYQEYICPWDIPTNRNIVVWKWRRGWKPEDMPGWAV
jgi:hypothetical protein